MAILGVVLGDAHIGLYKPSQRCSQNSFPLSATILSHTATGYATAGTTGGIHFNKYTSREYKFLAGFQGLALDSVCLNFLPK